MPLSAERLLARGYVPREMPPTFTTQDFTQAHVAGGLPVDKTETECARHNLARVGGTRRPLEFPNPRSMGLLADVLEQYWGDLEAHLKASKFSMSYPSVTTSERAGVRSLRYRTRMGEKPRLRARHWRAKRFVLTADISQCYSSIYTHSIPWALQGKAYAKANKNDGSAGDKIDRCVRRLSNNQTSGIPIGPDSSFAIGRSRPNSS